jgi:hypothetical protein
VPAIGVSGADVADDPVATSLLLRLGRLSGVEELCAADMSNAFSPLGRENAGVLDAPPREVEADRADRTDRKDGVGEVRRRTVKSGAAGVGKVLYFEAPTVRETSGERIGGGGSSTMGGMGERRLDGPASGWETRVGDGGASEGGNPEATSVGVMEGADSGGTTSGRGVGGWTGVAVVDGGREGWGGLMGDCEVEKSGGVGVGAGVWEADSPALAS